MVQQILLFAQGKSGKRIALQLGNLLLDVAKTLYRTFPKSVKFVTDIPTQPLGFVVGNPTQLHQVIMNLCINARDAMPNGGTLTLAIAQQNVDAVKAQEYLDIQPGSYVIIAVSDTGVGIPTALRERIFEPFFTTKAASQGTGLGLSTAFSIVKNHGGFIELLSEEGKGTQFQVYLPTLQNCKTQTSPVETSTWRQRRPHYHANGL